MIQAERALRIMQQHESDYDHFWGKSKSKKDPAQAEAKKGKHLAQKAKDLLDKAGGIEGASNTVQNVMKYFKTSSPSDYEMSVGGSGEGEKKPAKTIMGLPANAVYVGGVILFVGVLYGLAKLSASKTQQARRLIHNSDKTLADTIQTTV